MTTQTEMKMNPVAINSFAWNEIATRDTEAVSNFYCTLFGWTTELAECTAGYTVFKLGDHPIAGMIEMNDEWPEDTPTHWGSYIYVDDVDATAAKVADAGGSVCCGPMDAGEGGRMAVLSDPAGAVISLYKGGDGLNAFGAGAFCWNELCTNDVAVACSFYADIFGWETMDGPESECPYTLFKIGEDFVAGMMEMHWEGKLLRRQLNLVLIFALNHRISRISDGFQFSQILQEARWASLKANHQVLAIPMVVHRIFA